MGQLRGAQLDGEFAFYASRRRLRARPGRCCRTGSLLSTPPAVDFWHGSEETAAGRTAGDNSFHASRRPGGSPFAQMESHFAQNATTNPCPQLDGEFAFYASRRRLRAWLGGGGGGARSWRYFFLRLAPPTLGLARGWAAEGRAAGRGVCRLRLSPPSRRRLRASPGGRWGGALPGPGVCFFSFHSPASRCEAQLC